MQKYVTELGQDRDLFAVFDALDADGPRRRRPPGPRAHAARLPPRRRRPRRRHARPAARAQRAGREALPGLRPQHPRRRPLDPDRARAARRAARRLPRRPPGRRRRPGHHHHRLPRPGAVHDVRRRRRGPPRAVAGGEQRRLARQRPGAPGPPRRTPRDRRPARLRLVARLRHRGQDDRLRPGHRGLHRADQRRGAASAPARSSRCSSSASAPTSPAPTWWRPTTRATTPSWSAASSTTSTARSCAPTSPSSRSARASSTSPAGSSASSGPRSRARRPARGTTRSRATTSGSTGGGSAGSTSTSTRARASSSTPPSSTWSRASPAQQLPEGVLVCNFNRGLMEHDEVVTLFHEFGHLVHHVLGGQGEWLRFSGVATEWDFVEAPSQMLEEWAWDADVLATFARNAAGETIPAELVAAMRRADHFGKGLYAAQQMSYAARSYYFHAGQHDDLTAYGDELQRRYSVFPPLEGAHMHCAFGHLDGYSSGYYTYMWSLVIAKDLFSAFDVDDMFAADVAGPTATRCSRWAAARTPPTSSPTSWAGPTPSTAGLPGWPSRADFGGLYGSEAVRSIREDAGARGMLVIAQHVLGRWPVLASAALVVLCPAGRPAPQRLPTCSGVAVGRMLRPESRSSRGTPSIATLGRSTVVAFTTTVAGRSHLVGSSTCSRRWAPRGAGGHAQRHQPGRRSPTTRRATAWSSRPRRAVRPRARRRACSPGGRRPPSASGLPSRARSSHSATTGSSRSTGGRLLDGHQHHQRPGHPRLRADQRCVSRAPPQRPDRQPCSLELATVGSQHVLLSEFEDGCSQMWVHPGAVGVQRGRRPGVMTQTSTVPSAARSPVTRRRPSWPGCAPTTGSWVRRVTASGSLGRMSAISAQGRGRLASRCDPVDARQTGRFRATWVTCRRVRSRRAVSSERPTRSGRWAPTSVHRPAGVEEVLHRAASRRRDWTSLGAADGKGYLVAVTSTRAVR